MSAEEDKNKPLIDYSKIKLERGETPKDINQRCLQLCKDYLGGVWLKVGIDEIEVRRLSGGLTNQLFYCALNEDKRVSDCTEPQEVAIRMYQKKHFNNEDKETDTRLTDTIVALMVSENGLGPKIYGLFEGGQIQKYYQHNQFRLEQQNDPKLAEELFKRLARIHAMEVPIKRSGNWIYDYCQKTYNRAIEKFDINGIIEKNNLQTLKDNDIGKEWPWLMKAILDIDSPITFTHIDFRGSNIMVTESDGIVLCDFEYSCYGFRGFDFGTILLEWGRDYKNREKLFVGPDDNTIRTLVEIYVKESVRLRGNDFSLDPRNTVEHIVIEAKVFVMVALMFIILFKFEMDSVLINGLTLEKDHVVIGSERDYKIYHELKQKYIKQNIFGKSS